MRADVGLDSVRLQDGRVLAFAEYGDPAGRPCVFFHGIPGSRLQPTWALAPLEQLRGIRLICPDRPGYGASTALPGHTFADVARDVVELLDQLRLARVRLWGVSGGAAPALACAALIGDRAERVVILSGMGPIEGREDLRSMHAANRLSFLLARRLPWLLGPVQQLLQRLPSREPTPGPDGAGLGALLSIAGVTAALDLDVAEAMRQGAGGVARELALHMRPWDFDAAAVTSEVHLWHGLQDTNAPVVLARRLASALPSCQAHFVSGGHMLHEVVATALLPVLRA